MTISGTGLISWTPNSINQGGLVTVKIVDGHNVTKTRDYYVYVSDAVSCPGALKSYWKLNESSAPFKDTISNLNATLATAGSTSSIAGKVGKAISFAPADITKPMLNVDHNAIYDIARDGKFSISLWFKKDVADDPEVANQLESLIGRMYTGGFWWVGLQDGKLLFQFKDDGDIYPTITQTGTVSLGQWHHVVAIYDGVASGSCSMKLYLDNALVSSSSGTNPLAHNFGYSEFAGDNKLNIAFLNYDAANMLPFTGSLDDIAFYNKALSTQEIATMYTDGQSGIPHCKPGNYAPQVRSESPASVNQGETYSYVIKAVDVDGDPLTISVPTKPSWMSYNATNKTLSGTPTNAEIGTYNVEINVTDGKVVGGITKAFTVTVNNVNDAPAITSTAVTAVDEDAPYSYTVTYQDIDLSVTGANELVTLSVVNKPSWLNFNASSGVLSGTPTNNDAGRTKADTTYQITIRATDKGGLFAEQVFSLKVKNINDAPVVNSQSVLTVAEDNSITIALANLNVTDVDDVYPTDFTLTVQNGSNYNFTGNTVTPFPNYNGTLTIPVKLNDGGGATIDYNVTVTVTPVNDAPVITSSVTNTTISEGVLFTYLFQVTDVDNTPTLSAVKKPSWLVFTPSNGILAGTPKFEDVGKDTITLRASDGTTNVDQTIILTIEKVNHKPVLSGNPQISVDEDQQYLYIPTATDQDGDELVYSAVTIPSWLSFDPATRELKGVPTNDAVGMLSSKNFNITLRVSDGKETADQSFTVTVFAVNDAPVITGQNDTLSFIASANFAITMDKLKVTDPDNPESDLTIEILSGNNYEAVGNIINVTTYRGRLAVNIRVKDKAASSATYKYIVMVEAGTSISNLKSVNNLVTNVYPIPAFESVTFEFGKIDTESAKLQITNSTGKLIKSLPIEAGTSNYEFMVNDLPQGIYYYNLVSGKEFQTGKFVVVK